MMKRGKKMVGWKVMGNGEEKESGSSINQNKSGGGLELRGKGGRKAFTSE